MGRTGLLLSAHGPGRAAHEGAEGRPVPDAARAAAIAAAIRAGDVAQVKASVPTLDATKVAAFEATRKQKMGEHLAASKVALEKLHATLTAEQRTKLVDAIVAKRPASPGAHGPGAHGGPGGPGEHGPFGGLPQGLELSEAQKEKLRAAFEASRPAKPSDAEIATWKAAHEARKVAMDAKLQSFKGDAFDAASSSERPS